MPLLRVFHPLSAGGRVTISRNMVGWRITTTLRDKSNTTKITPSPKASQATNICIPSHRQLPEDFAKKLRYADWRRLYAEKTIETAKKNGRGFCNICHRFRHDLTVHHLIPSCFFNGETDSFSDVLEGISNDKHNQVVVCWICHRMINRQYTVRQQAERFSTLVALQGDPTIREFVEFRDRQELVMNPPLPYPNHGPPLPDVLRFLDEVFPKPSLNPTPKAADQKGSTNSFQQLCERAAHHFGPTHACHPHHITYALALQPEWRRWRDDLLKEVGSGTK